MNDADIFKSIAPERWTLLGLPLRPFALGHLILLHRLGSPLVMGGDPEFLPLATAVFICSRSYEEALAGIDDPTLPKAMKRWFRKLGEVDVWEKWFDFLKYMGEGDRDWTPHIARDAERTRLVGIPLAQSIRVKLLREFKLTESEVMNRPWALCRLDFYTMLDQDGVITLWNDDNLNALSEMRAKAAAFDEKLRAGKVEVRWQ